MKCVSVCVCLIQLAGTSQTSRIRTPGVGPRTHLFKKLEGCFHVVVSRCALAAEEPYNHVQSTSNCWQISSFCFYLYQGHSAKISQPCLGFSLNSVLKRAGSRAAPPGKRDETHLLSCSRAFLRRSHPVWSLQIIKGKRARVRCFPNLGVVLQSVPDQ